MSKKMKLVPELRFPEFEKEGAWIEKPFEKLKFDVSDGNYSAKYPRQSDFLDSGVPFLRANNLKFGTVIDDDMRFISEEQHSELTKGHLKKGDILITTRGELGKASLAPDRHIGSNINAQLVRINSENKLDNTFLYQLIGYLKTNGIFDSLSTGTALKQLPIGKLNQLRLLIPISETEQQKIASCLSSLDELLAAHSDKLDALKAHKKGLLQNLFPQDGETVPRVRFPEFEGDGEWVEDTLDNVAKFSKGKGISKSDISENGKLPCIRYGELYTHYNETISVVKSHTNLSPTDLVLSKANDVIIPASGETQIDIATASCVLDNGIALGGDLNIIRTKINGVFLSYYLNNAKKRDIAQMAQGISVVHLYSSQLKTLTLRIPNPKEQQKIASCLSTLDELITAQSDKIEHLQQHKKGLMQGLFPKIEG